MEKTKRPEKPDRPDRLDKSEKPEKPERPKKPKKTKEEKKKTAAKIRKIIGRALAVLLALVLLAAAAVFLLPLTERVDGTEVPDSADWMAELDDDLPLTSVTLPGTHNSGTQYAQFAFFSKCQALTVREQLEAGYRYLDIRLDGDDDYLKLTHGFTECRITAFGKDILTLADVLEDCYIFLDEHPTEAVAFVVKQESGDLSVGDIQWMLDAEIGEDMDRWVLSEPVPTVGEARGKLVLFRRWEDEAGLGTDSGIPFGWKDQGGSADPTEDAEANYPGELVLWVQDRYEYGIRDKWASFTEGLDTGVGEGEAAVHFLSTKGPLKYGHPYHFARSLNKKLLRCELPEDGPLGWIVVDFGSAVLAEHIYEQNFR